MVRQSSFTLAFFFSLFCFLCKSQVVDKTRLEYYDEKLVAGQLGMTVSQDGSLAAFVFDNGQLIVMDLTRSKVIKKMEADFTDLGEIRFTKDKNFIILIEKTGFKLIDRKTGEIKMEETVPQEQEIKTADVSSVDNVFVLAVADEARIYDAGKLALAKTIKIDKDLFAVSFSPRESHLIINPKYGLFKNRIYIYDYKSGDLVNEYKKKLMASYDNTEERIFMYQYKMRKQEKKKGFFGGGGGSGYSPVLSHMSLKNENDIKEIFVILNERGSDVGFYNTVLRVQDKLIGAAGYRGFSAFDLKEGGKVFTTKKTKKERSRGTMGILKDYIANPHYKISEDRALINAYGDNINQIYSASQNAIIGYVFVDGDGEFAIVTRDGRFDGTVESAEKLYWTKRNSGKKTSLESTFARGFTPNLLLELTEDEKEIAEFDIEEQQQNTPGLVIKSFNGKPLPAEGDVPKFISNQKVVNIAVEVTDNLGDIAQVKLFQNNKLVAIEEKPEEAIIEFEARLTNTFGENNYFYAVATGENEIDSEKQKMVVKYTGKTDEDPRLFLMTVGINEYYNPKYNLNYAIADANAFEKAIIDGASGVFNKIENIEVRNADFTKSEIVATLNKIKQEANEQDMFIFYYAGHGVMSQGTNQEPDFYIVPHDVTQLYGRDDMLNEKAISASELKDISKNINAQKQVFILDACQSAAALDVMAHRGVAEERAIAQLARSTGTFWITATGSEQFATEFESLGHGVFTYALVEGLSGKADGLNPDQKITVRELNAYIEQRVPALAEEYKGTPQFPSGYSFGNDFPLVVY